MSFGVPNENCVIALPKIFNSFIISPKLLHDVTTQLVLLVIEDNKARMKLEKSLNFSIFWC